MAITPAVTVTVLDAFSNPVSGQAVVMSLTTGTGVLSGTLTQNTDVSGVATFNDLSINLVGGKNITATLGALNVASNAFNITVGAPASINFTQQPTNTVAGVAITPAVTVTVLDGFGNPVSGQAVVMTLTTGSGVLSGTLTQNTDASGVATFNDLSINLIGSKNLTATLGALNVVSSAFTITSATPAGLGFVQQPTNTVAGATISPAVTALVVDAFGNPVSGQAVTIALTTGTGVLSGTLTQNTDAGGVATFADLSINLVGSKNLTVTSGALTPAVSNAFLITSGTPASINFTQQPTDEVAGVAIAPAVTVTVLDGLGNPVSGQAVVMTLTTGTGVLSGTTTQNTDASGVATFNDLNINLVGSKNITATLGALNVISNAFNITASAPGSIAFTQQPTNTVAGVAISPAVTATVLDTFGNPVSGQAVTIALTTGTGVLSGTLTQNTNASGVATFADLSINLIGSKNLTVTSGALTPAVSNAFTITSAAPAILAFVQQPTDEVAGVAINPAVTLSVTDAFGNPINGQAVTVALTTGTGVLSGTLTQNTDALGIATFNDLSINLIGSKNITATSGVLTPAVSNAFLITSGAPASINFSQQPTNEVAGVAIAPAVTVTILDGLGNPVSGQAVTVALTTGTGVLSGTLTQNTDVSGVATFNDLSINLIGSKNITASAGVLNVVSSAFTITAAAPASLAYSQQPTDETAGVAISPAVTLSVTDAFGNPINGQAVTVALTTGTGILSGTLTQNTNASGIATFNDLSINLIGSKNLTATSGVLTPAVSNAFLITAGTANTISFSQQPTMTVAGVAISPAVTVLVLDNLGNPVNGQAVTMSLSTGTGVLSGTLTQNTDASGVATFPDLSINLVGSKNLTATLGALTVASNPFLITAAALASIAFAQQPTDEIAGVAITPSVAVAVLDAFGNGVGGQNVTIALTTGTGVLSGTLTQTTNGSGVATFPDLSINLIGSKNLTATSGVLTPVVSNAFNITAGAPASIGFAQQPTDAVAGVTIAPAVTVTVLDGFGNPVIGQNVVMSLTTGTGVLSGTLTQTTNASGISTFGDMSINLIGSKNLTATLGALNTVSNAFTITAAAPANLGYIQQPTNTVAGANIAPAVTLSVTDAFGNPINGQAVTIALTTGTGVLSGTLTQNTDALGIATFANLNINLIGSKNITATSGVLPAAVSNAFLITAGAPASINFSQQPTNAVAGVAISPAVTVTVLDGLGNPINGQAVAMTLTTGSGVLSGTLTQNTNASGVATFPDLSINLIGSKNITATAGAVNIASNAFTITSASPAGLGFSQQPTDEVAGVAITPAVTALVVDAFGNPVSGQSVTLALTTGTGVLSGTLTQNTDAGGIATFNDLSINLIGSKNLTATSGVLIPAVSNAFNITASAPTSITFSQQPTDEVAGVAIAPAVTVTVLDGFGNPVIGQNVVMTLTTGTGVLSGTTTQTTNASGVATFNDLSINLIGSKNITATLGALNVISNAFNITASAPGSIAFSQQPTDEVAGVIITPAVTATILDAFGNPVSGQAVTIALTTGTGVLSGTLTQNTDALGVATFNDLSINLVGSKNLTVTSGALTPAVSNAFLITSATPTTIAFVQQPTDEVAGVAINPAVTVSVTDAFGNGVSGQSVTVALTTGTGVLSGTLTQNTNASGIATFNDLSINLIGSKNITATSGVLTPVVSNAFNITASAPTSINFSQQPTDEVAGVAISPAVTVMVLDAFGNPVIGQNVVMSLTTGTGVLSGTLTQTTNVIGIATFNDLSINLIGSKNITATLGALNTASNPFLITSAAPATLAYNQQPTNAVAGVTIAPAVTATVTDAFGNPVSGQAVTIALTTGTGALSGTLTQNTDVSGIATFADLSINLIGSKNLTVTSGALTPAVSNAFLITSATSANINFSQQPTNTVAGVAISPAVTATVTDAFGNPINGQAVTVALTTGTGVLSGTLTQNTNASGVATFADLSINLIGSKNLTATAGALNTVSNAFTITVSTPTSLGFIQQPTTTVAGVAISPAVTALLVDAFGNPISGQAVTIALTTGTGVLSGTLTQNTDASGIATFADLNINLIGSKNLTATSGALNIVSNAFNIVSSIGTSISFSQQPTDANAGVMIAPAVTVTVLDVFNNPVSGQPVTLALTTGTGVLSGTLTQNTDASGVATFNDLSINLIGSKNLTATAGALNVVSNAFLISAPTGTGTGLVIISGTPQQTPTSTVFANPLIVRVTDTFGNPVAGETVAFVANVDVSGATANLSAPAVTDVNGDTSVIATANGIIGAYTVTATYGATTVTFDLANIDPNVLSVNVICAGQNMELTIVSGSGNFDLTSTMGVGFPVLNVPLGTYTFFGPDTWLNITVTELGGDFESVLVGNVSCDATSGGGGGSTGVTSAPAPLDPNAIGCVLTSDIDVTNAPDNTYCRVLMRDSNIVTYPGAVPQSLIDLGVIFAVDIYRLQGGQAVTTFPDYTQICLSGEGRLFYLDARKSPRDITEMTTESVNGMTCAWLPATGTLVLTSR